MKLSLIGTVPQTFGYHKLCNVNNINRCKFLKNFDANCNNNLPNGKDLRGENMEKYFEKSVRSLLK